MVVRSARRATGIHTVVFGLTVSVKSVRGAAGSLNTFESTPSSFKRNNGPKYNGPRCRWRAPRTSSMALESSCARATAGIIARMAIRKARAR